MKIFSTLLLTCFLAFSFQVQAAEQVKKDLKINIELVQKQLDDLISQGGRYAYMQLAKSNGIKPFAAAIDNEGNKIMLEVTKADEAATFSQKILKLREMLKLGADKGDFQAVALFVQAKVPFMGNEVDGIAIEMEHLKGLSTLRFSPYEIDRESEKINFKQPVDKIKPVVFFKDTVKKQRTEKSKS
jgi:hypothetical protein